jgi:TolB-like protein/Tfp pilus assembly protein PilF
MDTQDIRAQLQKILLSSTFVNSESLIRILRAIVLETIEGRGDQLKEYVLGAVVLGKGPSFDPKADPIVRIQVGRLRSRLDRYYQTGGCEDPIIIEIPKGRYVPVFHPRVTPAHFRVETRHGRHIMLVAPLALVLVVAVCLQYAGFHAARSPISIAILPFSSLNSEPESLYFSEGVAEELIGRLMRTEHLRISRWPEKVVDIRELGRKLKVSAVLAGSIGRSGQRVRITASLTDAGNGRTLWAEAYDRELKDVFGLEDEVAGDIVAALGLELSHSLSPRSVTLNLHAFDLYLQGRYLLNWKDIPTTKRAVAKFQEAIAIDSSYAPAYAGLADCYERLMFLEAAPTAELLPKARDAIMEALRLDGSSAEAHTSLAHYFSHTWDFEGAARELQRAIQLNPNYALARMEHGVELSGQLRHEEGLAETTRAMQLEPLSLAATYTLGVQLLWARRYEQASEHLRKAAEIAPTLPATHSRLASVLLARGMYDEAIAEFQKAFDLSRGHANARALLAHAYAVSGKTAEARKLLRELLASAEHEYVAPVDLARVYLGLGERRRALEWVERAYALPASADWRYHLIDPMFDPIRSELKFVAVFKKLHLPSALP